MDRLKDSVCSSIFVPVSLVFPAESLIRPCQESGSYKIQFAAVGETVTFDLCVTCPQRPWGRAYFRYLGKCRENRTCYGSRRWSMRRSERYNEYLVTVAILSVKPEDYRNHLFTMMGPFYRTKRSDVTVFTLSLRESGIYSQKSPVHLATAVTVTATSSHFTVNMASSTASALSEESSQTTALAITDFTKNEEKTSSVVIAQGSTQPPPIACAPSWAQLGNSTCVLIFQHTAPGRLAESLCLKKKAELLNSSQIQNRDIQRYIEGISGLQAIWVRKSRYDVTENCRAYQIVSKVQKQFSCKEKLPFFCFGRNRFYEYPKISVFFLDTYTSSVKVADNQNGSLIWCERRHLNKKGLKSILIDANVTHIRVTCHADGWPQPDAFITSTLLGGEIKNLTVPSGASFLYSRPVSLFGPLGSIGCSAKNELGTVVSTDTVEISASPSALSEESSQTTALAITDFTKNEEKTSSVVIAQGSTQPPPIPCAPSWAQLGNSTCVLLFQHPAPGRLAESLCLKTKAELLNSSQIQNRDIQRYIEGISGLQAIWVRKSRYDVTENCRAYQIVSKDEKQFSCKEKLPFFCFGSIRFYEYPKISAFFLDTYTSSVKVADNQNGSLIWCERRHLNKKGLKSILIDANVTHIRVTCHADGWPQPDAFITSTLLGGEIKNLTVPSGASFLYSRPVSLFGPLGSIGCNAKNELGAVVSTDTVEISASREPKLVSFRGPLHQLQRGDSMSLRCQSMGFPAPTLRIIDEASGVPVNLSSSKPNVVEYAVQEVDCGHRGWYRCQMEHAIAGDVHVKMTHVEIVTCPPTCPRDFQLFFKPNDTRIQLSWTPSFNGGAQQSFVLFINRNNTNWSQYTSAIDGDITSVWRNVSEYSFGTNYSFRIVPTNVYLTGEPNASTCVETVHFSSPSRHDIKDQLPSGNVFTYGGVDGANIAIIIASILILGIVVVALFSSKIKSAFQKSKLRKLSIALESLNRLISYSDSNFEPSISNSSSNLSVFETNA
ncbi:hypothetical protein RRG08_034124 [Elysia crispata]|uniref:Ig-like domain-containing protein n=1 Tax=Elysia crispata TaxID=231223 RepID=A0AAE1DHU2_9GAST|nr:hypothetical protein RRG08_034124 [Elysia crispata]